MKILMMFLIILIALQSCSQKPMKLAPRSVMVGNVVQGNGVSKDEISDGKVDAAFALAMKLSGRFNFVDKYSRDSVASVMFENRQSAKLLDIAHQTKTNDLAFVRIDRFNNIIRVDLQLVDTKDTTRRRHGEGYSFLNFRNAKSNKALFDPSLLTAIQRAFAVAVGDSMLFANLGPNLSTKPVPTAVVAGILYEETPGVRNWDLLDKKTVSSYSAIESIFFASREATDFLVYDVETRDSIYQLFKLYLVDNYNLPTMAELDALRKFDIRFYIAGSYKQHQEHVDLTLSLFEITEEYANKIRTVSAVLYKDDLQEYQKELEQMTYELLKIQKIE